MGPAATRANTAGSHAGAWEPGSLPKGSGKLEITALVSFRSDTN